MKATALKLDGKPLSLVSTPPTIQKVKDFLDKSPADELFTREEICRRAHVGASQLKDIGNHEALGDYTERLGLRRLYGNPKAIALLRKQVTA